MGLLVGRTYLSGTTVSLVGGDPGVPMSHNIVDGRSSDAPVRRRLEPQLEHCIHRRGLQVDFVIRQCLGPSSLVWPAAAR
jgi:hypothetical protein